MAPALVAEIAVRAITSGGVVDGCFDGVSFLLKSWHVAEGV